MKLKDIKTKAQFEAVAENWYQRTHRLRTVLEDKSETKERREKAFKLFLIMGQRMVEVAIILAQTNTPKKQFPSGGFNLPPKINY